MVAHYSKSDLPLVVLVDLKKIWTTSLCASTYKNQLLTDEEGALHFVKAIAAIHRLVLTYAVSCYSVTQYYILCTASQ